MQFSNRLGAVASGATIRIDTIAETPFNAVPAGASDDTVVTPPPGWIYRLRSMELSASAPAAATTGTHGFFFIARAGLIEYFPFEGTSTYDRRVLYSRGGWMTANYRTRPPGAAAQQLATAAVVATESDPFTIRYWNNTDVAQNSPRIVLLTLERIAV